MKYRIRIFQLLLFALVLGFTGWMPGKAQDTGRVGLVVQYSDGSVVTRCITFSESSITGLDVLNRSDLSVISSYGSMGATICKIGNDGCSADDCFCQSPPNYWSYWYIKDGSWQYSNLGASGRQVQDGDVEGWRWGTGSAAPPLKSFSEICQQPTDTPTSTSTETPIPPTETLIPTDTLIPTETEMPLLENQALPTVTPRPTSTHAVLAIQATDQQQTSPDIPTVSSPPALETPPTADSAETVETAAPPTDQVAEPAIAQGQDADDEAAEPTKIALADQASGQENTDGEETSAEASVPSKATAGAKPALARPASADAASGKNSLNGGLLIGLAGYLAFGAILVGLLAFVVILLVMRRK